jgi:hypothetical protein
MILVQQQNYAEDVLVLLDTVVGSVLLLLRNKTIQVELVLTFYFFFTEQ